MKLYHGTTKENLDSIKTNGLLARVPEGVNFEIFQERGGNHAGVSLAVTMETALKYGEVVIEVILSNDTQITKIEMFDEILVNGNVGTENFGKIFQAQEETWVLESEVGENDVVVGPIKRSEGYAHIVRIARL